MTPELPVLEVIDQIRAALRSDGSCVLVAPPGTGKTTGVPPELLDEPWLGSGRIVVLEPRRLAARASAQRMAHTHRESIGDRFGYSVRGESRTSRATRIEVVTEGLFLRRLQHDPELRGVGAVILDEFHERSVDSDLALALLIDIRSSLRPDLRIMVMSATMEPKAVAALLDAPIVTATATMHPVETRYRPGSIHVPLENRVAEVISESLGADSGDVLVFLPGRAEINRTRREMDKRRSSTGGSVGRAQSPNSDPRIVELHGSLSPAEQQLAIEPDPDGRRKVILSTSLAETSITVPGVRVVIDAGKRRTARVDPSTGLPGLATTAVSRSGADQRRGRAGRTAPGVAYRLWAQEDDRHRPESDQPEILETDLSALLLQLHSWGVGDPAELRWLDDPPSSGIERAQELLVLLGALDGDGKLTGRGRDLAEIGFHPRLAAMAFAGVRIGRGDLAATVCALVESSRSGPVDLMERIELLQTGEGHRPGGDLGHSLRQWRSTIKLLGRDREERRARRRPTDATGPADEGAIAQILMAGYPDRIALRRESSRISDSGRPQVVFQLRTGSEVGVPKGTSSRGPDGWSLLIWTTDLSGSIWAWS